MSESAAEPIVEEIAQAIITARDFCGDERAAALQVFRDAGRDADPKLMARGLVLANRRWRKSQAEAMAKVLSRDERARAFADLETKDYSPKITVRRFVAPGF